MQSSEAAPASRLAERAARAFIGIGANLGRLQATMAGALAALERLAGAGSFERSSVYVSEPLDAGGPDYLNAVVALQTLLTPHELLAELQQIERDHGRERTYRNAPRTLDLDLLLHGDSHIETTSLTLPHPRLHERAFVLLPLAEIAPRLDIPGRGPLAGLLAAVAGQRIRRLER